MLSPSSPEIGTKGISSGLLLDAGAHSLHNLLIPFLGVLGGGGIHLNVEN
jgi:hypothetical protein